MTNSDTIRSFEYLNSATLLKIQLFKTPEQQKVAQDFVMSKISLNLVAHLKTSKNFNGMANLDKIPEL